MINLKPIIKNSFILGLLFLFVGCSTTNFEDNLNNINTSNIITSTPTITIEPTPNKIINYPNLSVETFCYTNVENIDISDNIEEYATNEHLTTIDFANENIEFSLPEYENEYQLYLYNKRFYDKDMLSYKSLYLRRNLNLELYTSQGVLIKGSEIDTYLRTVLSSFGYTNIQLSDCITYWLPLLKDSKYIYISFYDENTLDNELNINTNNTNTKRIFVTFTKVNDDNFEYEEQDLTIFENKDNTKYELLEFSSALLN